MGKPPVDRCLPLVYKVCDRWTVGILPIGCPWDGTPCFYSGFFEGLDFCRPLACLIFLAGPFPFFPDPFFPDLSPIAIRSTIILIGVIPSSLPTLVGAISSLCPSPRHVHEENTLSRMTGIPRHEAYIIQFSKIIWALYGFLSPCQWLGC